MEPKNTRDCRHGRLARSCDICWLEGENEQLQAKLDKISALLEDYKDAQLIASYHNKNAKHDYDYEPSTANISMVFGAFDEAMNRLAEINNESKTDGR